ncbi:helix-turn-helix domain-containing protein [Telluribacter sp.]|jgi:AraC-like DNA-binding protein|uniref:AraC family transcriptional regulator n=1 Tax=Telluribacter sp. TaxID=1978767 RepID=UPI002E0F8E4B|nr:helix-turn-helix domain-containing protein [Telluribacter sp.]
MHIKQIVLVALSSLGVIHGIFTAALLWNTKVTPAISNKLLSLLMVVLSVRIGKSVVMELSDGLNTLYIYLGLCLIMFIGPLFWLYSKAVIHKMDRITKGELIHFLPGSFLLLLAIPIQNIGFSNIPDGLVVFLFLLFYAHLLSYLLVVKFRYLSSGSAGTLPKESKVWLNILFSGLMSLWIVYVLNLFEEKIPYIIGPILYSAIVYTITYLALTRKNLQPANTAKYHTTGLSNEEADHLFASLEHILLNEKLYLNPDLSLSLLSKHLKTSTQKISSVINSQSGYNFNDYINRYRIDYAVRMMKEPQSKALTIAAVSFDSGFNSLSSFNKSFKRFTGLTPSAFRSVNN